MIFDDSLGEANRKYNATGTSFAFEEWSAFFFEEMNIPTLPYADGDDLGEIHRKEKEMFVAALGHFPMLSRMDDHYSDSEYNSHEVSQLLNECSSVLTDLTNPLAISFTNGLIQGCRKAIESGFGVSLGAD